MKKQTTKKSPARRGPAKIHSSRRPQEILAADPSPQVRRIISPGDDEQILENVFDEDPERD